MPGAVSPTDSRHLHQLAAGLCALCYSFSGAVLFQYCNVVFLVGAAWLPFALLAANHMLSGASVDLGSGVGNVPGTDGTRR